MLVVLLDDVGFGASSAFGGPVNMPTAERLAAEGLRYTRFHTTALCSPTRAALLSGRNHHVGRYVDGANAGEGRVDATQPMLFSADETTDVGGDSATPVSDDYNPRTSASAAGCAGSRSTWTSTTTTTSSGPEERLRIAMTRQ